MHKADYSKLVIDISDIWKYEFEDLKVTKNLTHYDKLLAVIEPIISQHHKPFLVGTARTDSWALKYYTNYSEKYKSRSIDYFEFDGDYYEYDKECVVGRESNQPKDFSFLFALKLRQYHDNLTELDSFLYHQLKMNFKGDFKKFLVFIKSILIQFSTLLGEAFEKRINLWEASFDPSIPISSKDEWFWENDESWEKVNLSLIEDEVRLFFSFLYLERNDKGLPYLERKEVEKLFCFGFKIPPMPLEEKFQLNLTAKHRKSIIEQCFYRFFENFGGNQKDKQPYLRFLAYTIQDFEKNQTPKQFKNWGKNFTDNKFNTESIPFNLQHYIDKAAARIRRKKE